jgi:hypothetical protein
MMNHNNQDHSKNNGRSEHSKGSEQSQKQANRGSEKEPMEQGEAMARSFMQGRGFRALCAAGAMLMLYRMGRRVMARRRRAREARQ